MSSFQPLPSAQSRCSISYAELCETFKPPMQSVDTIRHAHLSKGQLVIWIDDLLNKGHSKEVVLALSEMIERVDQCQKCLEAFGPGYSTDQLFLCRMEAKADEKTLDFLLDTFRKLALQNKAKGQER